MSITEGSAEIMIEPAVHRDEGGAASRGVLLHPVNRGGGRSLHQHLARRHRAQGGTVTTNGILHDAVLAARALSIG